MSLWFHTPMVELIMSFVMSILLSQAALIALTPAAKPVKCRLARMPYLMSIRLIILGLPWLSM